MEIRNISITKEQAIEWYNSNEPFKKELALSVFNEDELETKNSWERSFIDFPMNGFFIYGDNYKNYSSQKASISEKSVFKTEKQCKSALAYAQLTQLMALPEYNGDWEPLWYCGGMSKHAILRSGSNIIKATLGNAYDKIVFKSESIRDAFYDEYMDLLKTYFELD